MRVCTAKRLRIFAFAMVSVLPTCLLAEEGAVEARVSSPKQTEIEPGLLKLSFPTTETLERADLYFRDALPPEGQPVAVLVLIPGRNGNGLNLINRPEWRDFAREHRLLLCGVSFASNKRFVDESYSNGHSGSADLLLRGIEEVLASQGRTELPLLLYGFSAGARFTASFVESNSDRVLAWCGYAVGKWERARRTGHQPPGIVASGEWDAGCYHASLLYFQQGRKLGKPWVWLSLAETGHQRSDDLDRFVRDFFVVMMKRPEDQRAAGDYFDIDTKKLLKAEEIDEWPIFAGWVPTGELQHRWLELHHP